MTFTLTVTDDGALTATDDVTVTVTGLPPSVTTPAALSVAENTTAVTTLVATDPDTAQGDLVWSIPEGLAGVTDSAAFSLTETGVLSFNQAPDFESASDANRDGIYEVTVHVSDGARTAAKNLRITVTDTNEAPTAQAGNAQTVDHGAAVSLTGSGTDPDAGDTDDLAYSWAQTGGSPVVSLSGDDTATASFTAPSEDTTLTFTLTVTDQGALTATDDVAVTVTDVNEAPTAAAGPDQAVDHGAPVTLTGSGSDPDPDDVLRYSWAQTGGTPVVNLSGRNTATASFTAPSENTVLRFTLTVTDQGALTATDEVVVTVIGATPQVSGDGSGLVLDDFDSSGLVVDALALVEAGAAGSGDGAVLYAVEGPERSAAGSLVDGELGLGSGDSALVSVGSDESGSVLRLSAEVSLGFRRYFGSSGDGADLSVWVQTADGVASFTVLDNVSSIGWNYMHLNVPRPAAGLLGGISEGERFILGFAGPSPAAAIDVDVSARAGSLLAGKITFERTSFHGSPAVGYSRPPPDRSSVTPSEPARLGALSIASHDTDAVPLPYEELYALAQYNGVVRSGPAAGLTDAVVLNMVDLDALSAAFWLEAGGLLLSSADAVAPGGGSLARLRHWIWDAPCKQWAPAVQMPLEIVSATGADPAIAAAYANTALGSLELAGATLSVRFDPAIVDYRAAADGSAATVTISASPAAAQACGIAIAPADSDPDTAGHQVDFDADSVTGTPVTVTVTAADGSTGEYTVTVTGAAPEVTTAAAVTAVENATAVATLAASDADTAQGDLVWSIPAGEAGGLDAALFSLSEAGELSFVAEQDFEAPGDAGGDGAYEVVVQVSDGVRTAAKALSVTVTDENEAPAAAAGADQAAAHGAAVSLVGAATDPDAADAGGLSYSWAQTGGSPLVDLSGETTTTATFTAPSGDTVLTFTLTVTDRGALTGTDEVMVVTGAARAGSVLLGAITLERSSSFGSPAVSYARPLGYGLPDAAGAPAHHGALSVASHDADAVADPVGALYALGQYDGVAAGGPAAGLSDAVVLNMSVLGRLSDGFWLEAGGLLLSSADAEAPGGALLSGFRHWLWDAPCKQWAPSAPMRLEIVSAGDADPGLAAAYSNTGLGSLELTGATLSGPLDPAVTSHTAVADDGAAQVTISASPAAAQACDIAITPADAAPDTDGHQVDLASSGPTVVTVTVTAADGGEAEHLISIIRNDSPAAPTTSFSPTALTTWAWTRFRPL